MKMGELALDQERLLPSRRRRSSSHPTPTSYARQRLTARYDLSLPANQRKLEAAEALAQLAEEAGMSLIEMAIAFAINHPAITAAIIGPRTMEQLESQLPAADVELSEDVFDRIDEIVAPGTNINPADGGWVSPAPRAGGATAHGGRMTTWTDEELRRIGEAQELQLASARPDGTIGPYVTMCSASA